MSPPLHSEVVDGCIAQARKWAGSRNDGWAPNREQVTILADEVERLREERSTLLRRFTHAETWDEVRAVEHDLRELIDQPNRAKREKP